jgi:hypothetical protein
MADVDVEAGTYTWRVTDWDVKAGCFPSLSSDVFEMGGKRWCAACTVARGARARG